MASVTANLGLRLGWIGPGSMGGAMTKNIHKHLTSQRQPPLRFFNQTASRGGARKALGSILYRDVAQVPSESDVMFISVSLIHPFYIVCVIPFTF